MSKRKMKLRIFTIADYEEEERWLRQEHRNGWKIVKMVPPCFYFFEKCQPEDVVYRLAFRNQEASGEYQQLFSDYGWDYVCQCTGWLYFAKPASQIDAEAEGEIFSDNESRVEMVQHIMKKRLWPLRIIFLCCVLPQTARGLNVGGGFLIFWLVLLVIYVVLLLHCERKLRGIQRKFS